MFKRYSRTLGKLIKLGAARQWKLTYRGEVKIPWEGKTVGPAAWMNAAKTRVLLVFTDETGCDIALIKNDKNAPYSRVGEYMTDFGHNPDQLIAASRVSFTKPASFVNPDEVIGENPGIKAYLNNEYEIVESFGDIEGYEHESGTGTVTNEDYVLTLSVDPPVSAGRIDILSEYPESDAIIAVRPTVYCSVPYNAALGIDMSFPNGSLYMEVIGDGIEQTHKGAWSILSDIQSGPSFFSGSSTASLSSWPIPGSNGTGEITVSEIGVECLCKK